MADYHHPYFPSGSWQGVYKYPHEHDGSQHQMRFTLDFEDGRVVGTGTDDVGPFTWEGVYSTESFEVKMVKSYATHVVHYEGMADGQGIYGRWDLLSTADKGNLKRIFGDDFRKQFSSSCGGFHLWPVGEQETEAISVEEVSAKEMVI